MVRETVRQYRGKVSYFNFQRAEVKSTTKIGNGKYLIKDDISEKNNESLRGINKLSEI